MPTANASCAQDHRQCIVRPNQAFGQIRRPNNHDGFGQLTGRIRFVGAQQVLRLIETGQLHQRLAEQRDRLQVHRRTGLRLEVRRTGKPLDLSGIVGQAGPTGLR